MLKVIKSTPKSELYHKAYIRKLEELSEEVNSGKELDITKLMSLVFLGTKAIISSVEKRPKDLNVLIDELKHVEAMKLLMAQLTPKEFMNVFPIDKTYDGEKCDCKDYFYTMEMIRSLDQDVPIGDKLDDFLWDYMNVNTRHFQVEVMGLTSDIARTKGELSLMERISSEFGMPLYYSDKKKNEITGPITIKKAGGEYYFDDSKAKTKPIKKSIPDYLKIYSGGGANGSGSKLH